MQIVSQTYLDKMAELVRQPSLMELDFYYPTGVVTYTTEDISKVTETKTAHLIAGELPSITLTMELLNDHGNFDPNSSTGLHDMIVEGIKVIYKFGYRIGVDTVEWINGGEVFTDGELDYDDKSLTVTINAVDYLSKLERPIFFGHGLTSLKNIAQRVIDQTDYPEDNLGNKKIVLSDKLEAFTTAFNISGHRDEAISAKEWLQIIAHAGGVQMYIDREGYLHLDTLPEEQSPTYHLPLLQQKEYPEHSKMRVPKKLILNINTDFDSPIEVDVGGGGEDMVVDNPYIILKSNAEILRQRIEEKFIPYRNEANISTRGEPALDVLDVITFDSNFGDNIEGTIVESTITFDGTLSGELVLRYIFGGEEPTTVKILGEENFYYPLYQINPTKSSISLECVTDIPSPTYQWSYYSIHNGVWANISGATSKYLTITPIGTYFNNDDSVLFKCTISGSRASSVRIAKIHWEKSEFANYRGVIKTTSQFNIDSFITAPEVGDVVLLDNTEDNTPGVVYGETFYYNGVEWISTNRSEMLSLAYKDALELADSSGKSIYTAEVFANLLANQLGGIKTITKLYALSSSCDSFTPIITPVEWVEEAPSRSQGEFLWTRDLITYLNNSTSYTSPSCVTGDKGDAGAVGQGVESIIEEYYLSTSKTERIGGSWVTNPPTWSTGKYMWTRSKITYKNPTDTEYTTPVCDSSWEAVNLTEDELKKYIQSRGENLITNGSGLLGSNYNFSAFTYDGSEAYYSNGSFRYYGEGTKFTDEFMPVNPELAYKLSMFAKTANGVGRYYAMVVCFDVDNQVIMAKHHMYRANTLTTLSQELKNGDTVVHLTDASNWYNDGTAGVNTHLRSIILWNYKNSYGYLYPPQTYSRNWIGNAWNPGAINFENNTITLISPWAGGTVEAGTPLSNGSSGNTYKYCAMSNTIIPTTWTEYAGVMSGIDLSGSNVSDKFPPGTAKVKIGWLLNYQGSGETIWIANLAFNIHLATQSELDSTKLIVNSSVKSTDVEYYLSTSSTSLSGGSWQTTAPAWVDGKFMWSRTRVELNNGTVRYTPSESGTCIAGATGPEGPSGEPARVIEVVSSHSSIIRSAREAYKTLQISVTAKVQNIVGIPTWTVSHGDWEHLIIDDTTDHFVILLDATTVEEGTTITATISTASGSYSASTYIDVIVSGGEVPYNFGGVTEIPRFAPEGSLIEGDYFLWSGGHREADGDDPEMVTGQMYVYNGEVWEASFRGDLLMTMMDSVANLPETADPEVFAFLVAKKFIAIQAVIDELFTNQIKLSKGGAIYSGYSADGNTPPPSGSGFWLGANGKFKAYFAELLGTLRTGRNAPTDARVAIQDEIGITSGPTFTGSGLNDLTITKAGDVAGDFRVKISGINNGTDSGKEGYWATPFQVGTFYWRAIAVNSSGRFVAVGGTGGSSSVSYSDDGITWATPFQVGDYYWHAIAVNSSGRFVAVGGRPVGDSGYMTYSDDGINWATPFQAGGVRWQGIGVNSSGRFVAGGSNGYITYSNDGITWATPFRVGTYNWNGIAVNSAGKFVAVGNYGYISYSNDGITWATPFKVSDYYWRGIAVNSSGKFVAVGEYGYITYSNDGITWVTPFQVGNAYWLGIAVNSSGRFVAVGVSGYITYSDDGITWATPFRVGTYGWLGIAVNSSGRFVAVGEYGYITMSLRPDTIQISSNGGTTWGSDIPIPAGEAISITGFGIDILFGHTEGHTVGDYWSFEQKAMRGLAITDSAGNEYLSASNGKLHLLEGGGNNPDEGFSINYDKSKKALIFTYEGD